MCGLTLWNVGNGWWACCYLGGAAFNTTQKQQAISHMIN